MNSTSFWMRFECVLDSSTAKQMAVLAEMNATGSSGEINYGKGLFYLRPCRLWSPYNPGQLSEGKPPAARMKIPTTNDTPLFLTGQPSHQTHHDIKGSHLWPFGSIWTKICQNLQPFQWSAVCFYLPFALLIAPGISAIRANRTRLALVCPRVHSWSGSGLVAFCAERSFICRRCLGSRQMPSWNAVKSWSHTESSERCCKYLQMLQDIGHIWSVTSSKVFRCGELSCRTPLGLHRQSACHHPGHITPQSE